MPAARRPRRDGFTLIELLVVIAIIGILITLILVAASDGVRRAEERQTQTLITKLEAALTDRVDALLATNAPINQTHRYLGAITFRDSNGNPYPIPGAEVRRAQVIAQFDFMKAELPDVFFQNGSAYVGNYPLNFAAPPYPLSNPNGIADFALPLGNRSPGLPYTADLDPANITYIPRTDIPIADSGIFGASFHAAAGFYKNLYEAAARDVVQASPGAVIAAKKGYDSADNDGDGLVDEMDEITVTGATLADFRAAALARLAKHDHKTARAEALYAVLVEGQGPLGSLFDRDEFTARDVADTDGDGLPEFIDAWGEPLQFYRWPIYFGATTGSSDSQKGYLPYDGNVPRQLDPLDPNQQVVSFAWWTSFPTATPPSNPGLPTLTTTLPIPDFSAALSVNGPLGGKIFANSPASPQANAFMTYFHITIDPQVPPATLPAPPLPYWDRTGATRRRAYNSKFLVLSGGPDKEPGTFQLNKDYQELDSAMRPAVAFPTGSVAIDACLLNWCESQAAQVELTGRNGAFLEQITAALEATPTSQFLQGTAGVDDITNQTLTGPGAGAK